MDSSQIQTKKELQQKENERWWSVFLQLSQQTMWRTEESHCMTCQHLFSMQHISTIAGSIHQCYCLDYQQTWPFFLLLFHKIVVQRQKNNFEFCKRSKIAGDRKNTNFARNFPQTLPSRASHNLYYLVSVTNSLSQNIHWSYTLLKLNAHNINFSLITKALGCISLAKFTFWEVIIILTICI